MGAGGAALAAAPGRSPEGLAALAAPFVGPADAQIGSSASSGPSVRAGMGLVLLFHTLLPPFPFLSPVVPSSELRKPVAPQPEGTHVNLSF